MIVDVSIAEVGALRSTCRRCIEHGAAQQGLDAALEQATDTAVVNAIARVTGGNFRMVELLFAQIKRVLEINELHTPDH